MKKTYIAPAVAAVKLDATGLMAVSSLHVSDTVVDTSNGEQLGRDDHRGSGNVWDQSW
jgi:hypothetical protein